MGKLRRHFATVTAALAFVCLLITKQVESTSSFELRLHRFSNPGGRDASGGCCGAGADLTTTPKGICPAGHGCPVSFRVCVKNYQISVDSSSPCIIGEFLTRIFDDDALPRLNETPPIIFYFNFTWTGSFSFVIEAYHTTEKTGERMLVSRFAAQRSLTAKLDWTTDQLTANHTRIEVSYRVRCQANYFGEHCDVLCKPRNDSFGHYTCRNDGQKVCLPGWEGHYCSTAVCRPGCHEVHGHCKHPHDCTCRPGWEGKLCDACSRYPGCEHGTCAEPWQCHCNEGWGGLFCNQDLNYCTNHRPCKNGGTCTNTGQGSYTCSCSEEYMGRICDILRNPCQNNPCQNGGICSNPSEGNHTCKCALGFYGPNCETSANICSPNPCSNGGSCVHDPRGFACACLPGFFGSHCEKTSLNCMPEFCLNGGTCTEKPSGPLCRCHPGFLGVHCELRSCIGRNCSIPYSGACSSSPCLNGGLCKEAATNDFSCQCPKNYSGEICQVSLVEHLYIINVPHHERSNYSTAITNISHQVSDEPKTESRSQVAVILSCTVIALTTLVTCAICLSVKFCRRRQHRKPKRYVAARDDELKQNEKNMLRMNNNKCAVPQNKIVNTLDRIPVKVNNEGPAKVVNAEIGKSIAEKNNLCVQRTLERRENNSSTRNSGCHSSLDCSPCNAGTVFVIQDHIRQLPLTVDKQTRPPSLGLVEEDVFATDV